MDILMAARDVPEINSFQYAELVRTCLQTHAWCVREEYNRNLLLAIAQGGAPLGEEIIKNLLEIAEKERTDHATHLSAFATSLLSNFTKH